MKTGFATALFLLLAFSATAADKPAEPKVYGNPGNGRIHVEVRGGSQYWKHPGVYWIEKGSAAVFLYEQAGPKVREGAIHPPGVIIWRGGDWMIFGAFGGKFRIIILQDGDVIEARPFGDYPE